MKCLFPNNHVVAVIDEKNYIVDLGSPISFSYNGEREVEIEGKKYPLTSPLAPKEMADQLTGLDISGFIGTDILKATNLTINKEDETISFGLAHEDNAPYVSINTNGIMGYSYVISDDLTINGNKTDAVIFDTGACIPYVHPEHLRAEDNTGIEFHDVNPAAGNISGTLYNVSICAPTNEGPVEIKLQAGEMPGMYAFFGIDAFINPMSFSDRYIAFDFEKGVMYFGK